MHVPWMNIWTGRVNLNLTVVRVVPWHSRYPFQSSDVVLLLLVKYFPISRAGNLLPPYGSGERGALALRTSRHRLLLLFGEHGQMLLVQNGHSIDDHGCIHIL